MKATNGLLPAMLGLMALAVVGSAHAAAPGVTGNGTTLGVFDLTAQAANISEPDGQSLYSWGYGCVASPTSTPTFAPAAIAGASCSQMQVPGPTLIVTEGTQVTVNLTNGLPNAAGNTSILFPGFNVTTSCNSASAPSGVQGLLTCEAAPGSKITYTFTATSPGTRAYYSGTQGDLQVEMGLYGAIIVLPANPPANCVAGLPATHPGGNTAAQAKNAVHTTAESDFRLSSAAFDHPDTCYDREYLFQFSEMDPNIHYTASDQVAALGACQAGAVGCSLHVPTEPYHPAYFMINGRSMPDNMDPNYAPQYAHQPYNGNPHMHPGEMTLVRIVGQGRWQHPFHEHGNHVRVLARDGNIITADPTVAANLITYPGGSTAAPLKGPALAGPLLFTTTTTPGLAMDGIFYYTGRGLNWDMYGHHLDSSSPNAKLPCTPDINGYNTGDPTAINYFEWCQDHNKPVQVAPFGDVGGGGPVTLPDPNYFVNGPWYGGSPYLGPDATTRAVGSTGTTPPAGTIANSPTGEAGYAFMWHSHNEREITTNNIFPGGMLMMMLVDSREFVIDESN